MGTVARPTARGAARRARRILARVAVVAAALTLAVYLGISALAAATLTRPQRSFGATMPAAFGLAFDEVRFPARGGDVEIAGWFIPSAASRKAVVLVHGKDGNRAGEFQGRFVDFAAALHERGLAVLMIDMRGHGRSGDARLSFGIDERRDVEGAVDWLERQGFRPGEVGVLGVSMGAAASIGAAAEDADIGALVADCSYAAIYPIIQREWRAASGLPDLFLPSTRLLVRLLVGADIGSARPVEEIGRIAPRPVLIIHGAADQYIPPDHARQLAAADPAAQLWEVPGAGHGGSYGANPGAYVDRVVGFFERSLK